MISLLFVLINPVKQIQKGQDAKREQDLKQVNTALDTYYNDKNCYPLSLSFDSSWTPYMQKIPQDPAFAGGGSSYIYINDGSNCPQWNVLFAKISYKPASSVSCPLEQLTNCVPSNYVSLGYNYCVLSGKVDCAVISASVLPIPQPTSTPTPLPTPTPGPTSTPTLTATPTFTPTPTPFCSLDYSCTGTPLKCNVVLPAGTGQYCSSNCNGNCP